MVSVGFGEYPGTNTLIGGAVVTTAVIVAVRTEPLRRVTAQT